IEGSGNIIACSLRLELVCQHMFLPALAGLVPEKARCLPDALGQPLRPSLAPVRIPQGPEALEAIAQNCTRFRTCEPSFPREPPFKVSFRDAIVPQQTRFHSRHARSGQHWE